MKPASLSVFAAFLTLTAYSSSPPAASDPARSQGAPAATQRAIAQQNLGGQNPGSGENASQQTPSLEQQQGVVQNRVVPLRDEPHHRLILQNEFANVYTVAVPPNDETLMHRHDLPYLAVNFGPGNITNIMQGQKEAQLTLRDGQVIYSNGGFAHMARTNSGAAFRNVTVELVKPQGTARNLCKQVVAGPLACPQEKQQQASAKKKPAADGDDIVPYFETDEVRVEVVTVSLGRDYVEESPKQNALLIAMTNSNMNAEIGGNHISFLHSGDILWLPAGEPAKVNDFLGTRSNFLLVSFKDADFAKP